MEGRGSAVFGWEWMGYQRAGGCKGQQHVTWAGYQPSGGTGQCLEGKQWDFPP